VTNTCLAAVIAGTLCTLAPIPTNAPLLVDPDAPLRLDPEVADLLARLDAADKTIRHRAAVIAAEADTPIDWEYLDRARQARTRLEDWLGAAFNAQPRIAEPAPAAPPKAAPVVVDEPPTADNLPRTQAAADAAAQAAEDALWDHAEDCGACFDAANGVTGRELCWVGMRLRRALGNARDAATNWARYDGWLRRGGRAAYLENDWIA
jgi:hypothetical protein